MRWVLFEDAGATRLHPFTRLRPPSALLLGASSSAERWRRVAAPDPLVVACRAELAAIDPDRVSLESARERATEGELWISDRTLPDPVFLEELRGLAPDALLCAPGDIEEVRAFRVGPEIQQRLREASGVPLMSRKLSPGDVVRAETSGRSLNGLGDLVRWQEPLLREDLEILLAEQPAPSSFGDGRVYEPARIRLGDGCRIDYGAVLDAREGPIVLGPGCQVFPHTWIRGPFFAGRDCALLGGRIGGGTSLGMGCRVRGEVEASVFLGWSNKAHDGFVGHSYLGEWVNLGAFTTTSDLKNNYSVITLERGGEREPTGQRKVGVFFGDHVKTRIGCLLGCGTIVGIGSNLIGDPAVAVKWVPDFSWGWGAAAVRYDADRFLQTAEIVFGRRGVPWTPAMADLLRRTHGEA